MINELESARLSAAFLQRIPIIVTTAIMASLHLVPVNKTAHLGYGMKADGIIIFRSPQLNTCSTNNAYTSLNLLADNSDIVLHMGFRRVENVVAFNACSSGNWLKEERIPFGDRLRGNNHTVAVYNHGDHYQILFNGKTGHYFKKQLTAEVSSLQYLVAAGQDPLFSDPVAAETYVNLAALVAGIN